MSLNDKVCVISANNSLTQDGEVIDYIQLASIAAERVKHFLDLDTYLITSDPNPKHLDKFAGVISSTVIGSSKRQVITDRNNITYDWYNDGRIEAFELTRGLAKKILMIDADYMVASDQLKVWLDTDYHFHMFNHAEDITRTGYKSQYWASQDITRRWATAMAWNHSAEAEVIFDTARMVRDNYEFYATMFEVSKTLFRNDLAFSVACHLHDIPAFEQPALWNLLPAGFIYQLKKNWVISINGTCLTWLYDVHVMNKQYAVNQSLMDNLRLTNVGA